MKQKIVPCALILSILICTLPTWVFAQIPKDTWVQVKIVSVGETLTVEYKNGKSLKGEKLGTTDESLTLSSVGRDIEIKRVDIFRIYHHWPQASRRRGPRGAAGATLGGLLGLLVFAGLNAGDSGRSREEQRRYTRATALVIPAGAVAGFFVERAITNPSRKLIYEAP